MLWDPCLAGSGFQGVLLAECFLWIFLFYFYFLMPQYIQHKFGPHTEMIFLIFNSMLYFVRTEVIFFSLFSFLLSSCYCCWWLKGMGDTERKTTQHRPHIDRSGFAFCIWISSSYSYYGARDLQKHSSHKYVRKN